jgi:hypothetical protein
MSARLFPLYPKSQTFANQSERITDIHIHIRNTPIIHSQTMRILLSTRTSPLRLLPWYIAEVIDIYPIPLQLAFIAFHLIPYFSTYTIPLGGGPCIINSSNKENMVGSE